MSIKSDRFIFIMLLFSLVANMLLGYKYIRNRYYTYSPDYTYNRKELFEKLPVDSNAIVFMGNSLTQQFELAEAFPRIAVKNRGINGETTQGLLNRMANIVKCHPAKVFMEIGINDLRDGILEDQLLNNFNQIIRCLQHECPEAKIYVQAVFPVVKSGKLIENSKVTNESIRSINKKLKELSLNKNCTYIDTYSYFQLNGEMNPLFCLEDGLHLSGEGYLLWAKLLKPFVDN